MLPIHAELSPEERDAIVDRIAREVARRRLETPAILALELHRPLAFLGSQALVVFTPMLAPAFGLANMQRLSRLLEDRANLDRLIDRIEELAALAGGQGPGAGGQGAAAGEERGGRSEERGAEDPGEGQSAEAKFARTAGGINPRTAAGGDGGAP